MAKAKHSMFDLLFTAPKVGGQEKNFFSLNHAWNSKHRASKLKAWFHTNFLVVSFLLSKPKVGYDEQKKIILAISRAPSTNLRN
jgi:hypothetical protein